MSVTREKLYKEVWAEPMTEVAKRYEVSSSFLARVCERMNVPRPPRGHWAKLRNGVKVDQPPLPDPGVWDELEWSRGGYMACERRRPRVPTSAKPVRQRGPRHERPDVHPLVAVAPEHFERHRTSYDNEYLRPLKRNVVDVWCTKDTLSRALEMASAPRHQAGNCRAR